MGLFSLMVGVTTRLRSKVFSLGQIFNKPKEKEKKIGVKKVFSQKHFGLYEA